MKIPADLVVLSACETARGRVVAAEGVWGLTRAFMLAGAPRVVSSVWNADDEASAVLMEEFHRLWRSGTPTAEALLLAQRRVEKDAVHPQWSHPYYWASWQLWGLPN